MNTLGLKSKLKTRFVTTIDSNHKEPVAENILNRQFDPQESNMVYVSDITYIPTTEG